MTVVVRPVQRGCDAREDKASPHHAPVNHPLLPLVSRSLPPPCPAVGGSTIISGNRFGSALARACRASASTASLSALTAARSNLEPACCREGDDNVEVVCDTRKEAESLRHDERCMSGVDCQDEDRGEEKRGATSCSIPKRMASFPQGGTLPPARRSSSPPALALVGAG